MDWGAAISGGREPKRSQPIRGCKSINPPTEGAFPMRKLLVTAALAVVAYASSAAWRPADSAAGALAAAIQTRSAIADAIK